MIRLEDVVYAYPGCKEPVIDGLSLEIRPGEFLAVIGPNGSGKSTLSKLLNGLIAPDKGRVVVEGLDTADSESVWEVRRRVGLLLQNPDNQLLAPTVEEDVAFGPENLGVLPGEIRRRVKEALETVEMTHLAQRPPGRLSGGQKQRVALAGVLAMKPEYLVLDEATSMLDPKGRREVLAAIQRLSGTGIVLITHNMQEAALADRVAILAKGKIQVLGRPDEVFADVMGLKRWGLEAPLAARISHALHEQGAFGSAKGILTVEELVKAIC